MEPNDINDYIGDVGFTRACATHLSTDTSCTPSERFGGG